ncbi:unnamed protein product [Prunus brigantina]
MLCLAWYAFCISRGWRECLLYSLGYWTEAGDDDQAKWWMLIEFDHQEISDISQRINW